MILVINCGSSSVKAEVINVKTGNHVLKMQVERILDEPVVRFNKEKSIPLKTKGHEKALKKAFALLMKKLPADVKIEGVGHRVAHGGEHFDQAVEITEKVENLIDELSVLAPLHNPINLLGIQAAKKFFKNAKHIAVFDTAFHQTLPRRARTYALPKALNEKYGIRRYGFHGTSHDYVSKVAAKHLQADIRTLRLITCHLGSGCSVAAIEYGRSIETSMGMTPLEGLMMATRSGDLDAGVLLYLADKEGLSINDVDNLLNKESGLKGISGGNSDMRDIIERTTNGDEDARLALQVFTHRVKKYIGAYAAVMGGVDAIIFTGGIGENSAVVRHRVAQRLDYLGAIINEDKNHEVKLSAKNNVADFAMNHSRVRLLAVATDEQLSIAQQAQQLIDEKTKVNTIPTIPIAVSARHVHLTQETVEALFGKGYELTVRNWLSQPKQFAANETVGLVGPKNTIQRVRILGPTRPKNQVEISRTDEFFLGIDAPVRASGKVANTPGIRMTGPEGVVDLKEGVICAWRHIHMTPEDAQVFGVADKDIVDVAVTSGSRRLTFGNVLIRVSSKYILEMHIDTDEANAAELGRNAEGVLVIGDGEASLEKRKLRM